MGDAFQLHHQLERTSWEVVRPSWEVDSHTSQRVSHGEGYAVLDGNLEGRMGGRNGIPYVDVTHNEVVRLKNRETCIFDSTEVLRVVLLVEKLLEAHPSSLVALRATFAQERP